MKLTCVIILMALMQVSAATFGQNLTLNKNNISISKIFFEIRKQTGYDVLVKSDRLNTAKKIDVAFENVPVTKVLDQLLKGTELQYSFDNMIISITLNEKSFFDRLIERIQNIDVTGKVIDERNNPLAGASVMVKGSRISTQTQLDGSFTLKNVDENAILEISYMGYGPLEIKAQKNLGSLKLKPSNNPLDEIQIIAYGRMSKRLQTGNVNSLKSTDIEKQIVQNPLLALQGRIPGLYITQNSGLAGGGVTVRLQGQTSINATNGNDPLIVIDGVPYPSQNLGSVMGGAFGATNSLLGTSGGPSGAGAGSPLNYINPADIESIDVLKDADATAIYGSRAANGAILITMKKGKAGEQKILANFQQGFGRANNFIDLMNTEQYLEMRREAFKNDNLAIPSIATSPTNGEFDVNGLWSDTKYTDWQRMLIGNTSQLTNGSLNISGGTSNVQYLIGGTYYRESTIFPGDFDNKKGSLRLNLSTASANQKFKMQFGANYMADNNAIPNFFPSQIGIYLAPNAPDVYNPDGTLNWAPRPNGAASWTNPIANLNKVYKNLSRNLVTNLDLSYALNSNLLLKVNMGITTLATKEIITNPASSVDPFSHATYTRNSIFTDSDFSSWIVEPQIVYKKKLGPGNLDILFAGTLQANSSKGETIWASGFSNDQLMENVGAATTVSGDSQIKLYKYSALSARVNYNILNKYILNLSARRDGSSRFGAENRFHNFASVGAAWIFTDEKAMQFLKNLLSFGKLRGSYGITGNDQILDYQFMSLLSPATSQVYQGITPLNIEGIANPYLQWEATRKMQLGLDLGFFNERLLISTNYARNRSSNQLLSYRIPTFVGFSFITNNFPATVQNKSWEFSLNSKNINKATFSWSTNFNLTIPDNELVSFPNLQNSSYASALEVGQPLSLSRNYNFSGVDPTTGRYQFIKADGTITINPSGVVDRYIKFTTLPKFYGGFQNTFTYKAFQLDFNFQFVSKLLASNYEVGNLSPGRFLSGTNNQPIELLARWQNAGDITNIQKVSTLAAFGTTTGYARVSNSHSGSFIRLKSAYLSWSVPDRLKSRLKFQDAKLFAQGQNLLTITKFKGFDPENTTLPLIRYVNLGFQLSL